MEDARWPSALDLFPRSRNSHASLELTFIISEWLRKPIASSKMAGKTTQSSPAWSYWEGFLRLNFREFKRNQKMPVLPSIYILFNNHHHLSQPLNFFKPSLHLAWGSNSWPPDQKPHALPTEPAGALPANVLWALSICHGWFDTSYMNFSHLHFTSLWKDHYYPHFTEEEAHTERG